METFNKIFSSEGLVGTPDGAGGCWPRQTQFMAAQHLPLTGNKVPGFDKNASLST